ncbi:hypothetical protein [Methylobacterium persicinum]|uniref:Uncharacterized protein n=1 Tax=Methylobacterium persicinum TaxID=374426 RepID=A0ABU0HNN4_9HYPH|nr:hypothetical protein [Methylobacterium persicinum]MDQ0443443.1 hypothetical protein [Methylobacterium persicinum]GJE38633.1 hypothetical protein KHHGKMAE_2708 [Methylobacterium persicinum]
MQVTVADVGARQTASAARPARVTLLVLSALAIAAGSAAILGGDPTRVEPDLARVLRLMAAMKGTFALAAFTACYWRLARPANPWRMAIYVAAPPLMAAGAAGMWSLHHLGVAALGLHAGLFAVLAAALTDPDFLPALRLKSGRRL